MTAARRRLPNRRDSHIVTFVFECHGYRASISRFPDGRIGEIFLDAERYGSDVAVHANEAAILASLCLQSGVPAEMICRAIKGPIGQALLLFEGAGA